MLYLIYFVALVLQSNICLLQAIGHFFSLNKDLICASIVSQIVI